MAKVPEEAQRLLKEYDPQMSIPSWAVRFAASLDHVMVVLSGMSSEEQVLDNGGFMEEFYPLKE